MATETAVISRRALMKGLGGIAAMAALAPDHSAFAGSLLDADALDAPLFASARREADGSYAIVLADDAGFELAKVALPDRGHGLAVSPDRRKIMAFARRPGTFALLIDPFENRAPQLIASEPGRHFYGHGCFSPDGRLVYAVENDFEAARGVVGVYDVSGLEVRRLGELDTNGIGPHDILLDRDSRTLVIANGGIETHPGRPREKLNLDTMTPSVVFIDRKTGDLKASHALPAELHQLSLRHMAQDGAGRIWVGGQYEGALTETPPLVTRLGRDDAPKLFEVPGRLKSALNNYIGSVVASSDGDVIATSAPRGNRVLFWRADDGAFLGAQSVTDGCGVAPLDRKAFLISDGTGGMSYLPGVDGPLEVLARPAGVAWDNHLFPV
ncbi:DUF1513 domain-containing protein [Roseibium sp. RKSG952]|nr:DUF1513 domain-containing protein [Roseibium sp. RKSG952]